MLFKESSILSFRREVLDYVARDADELIGDATEITLNRVFSAARKAAAEAYRSSPRHIQPNQDPENFGPPKGTPDKKCRFNSADFLKLGLSPAFVS
jgi:hypothetical protein